MTNLTLERDFAAPVATVYKFLTEPENLLKWWGPETMHLVEHSLNFSKPGPWYSVIVNADGGRFKMSGQVISASPEEGIRLSWGWHDDQDQRGPESEVHFALEAIDSGTRFVLTHSGLADDEAAANHLRGWTATLIKLERLAA